jgi:signal transduction histidine kinase
MSFSDYTNEMKKSEVVDLNDFIRRTAELAQNHIQANGVQLTLKLSAKSPRVLVPPAELTRAMLDLMANAVEAATSEHSSGKVQITSAVIRDRVLVSIIDDAPAKRNASQLRYSRNIIRKIGGDVWAFPRESQGTAFTIDLPLGVPDPAATVQRPH